MPLNDIASTTGKIGGAAQKRLAFSNSYGLTPATLDEVTRAEAEELANGKYRDPAWLARVP